LLIEKSNRCHQTVTMTRKKISTESIETALEQIVKARTSKTKASINTQFVAAALKELINYRRSEQDLKDEVEVVFFGDERRIPSIVADEVKTLSELGNTSWTSTESKGSGQESTIDLTSTADLDALEALDTPKPSRSSKRPVLVRSGVHDRWADDSSNRKVLTICLLIVIAVVFGLLIL